MQCCKAVTVASRYKLLADARQADTMLKGPADIMLTRLYHCQIVWGRLRYGRSTHLAFGRVCPVLQRAQGVARILHQGADLGKFGSAGTVHILTYRACLWHISVIDCSLLRG